MHVAQGQRETKAAKSSVEEAVYRRVSEKRSIRQHRSAGTLTNCHHSVISSSGIYSDNADTTTTVATTSMYVTRLRRLKAGNNN